MTFTILPFLVAFMAGLALMPGLNIYSINAWNVGTAKVDPWRQRSNGVTRAVAAALTWFARLWRSRVGRLSLAVGLALLVAYLASGHGAALQHVTLAAIVPGTAAEMREKREKLIRDAGELMGPNNTFDKPEKRAQFDEMMADVQAYATAIEDVARGERVEALRRTTLPESQRQELDSPVAPEKAVYERALGSYLRGVSLGDMEREDRAALQGNFRNFTAAERRDMATYSGANGGFIVAPDTRFYGTIIQAMKFFGGMETAGAQVIETDTAGDMPIPMGDDTGNVGTIIPEAKASGHAGGVSPVLTELVLRGYLYSSKVVKVSWQMLRDPALDVEGYVGGLLGERLARIQNTHFTSSGTGAGMPQALTKKVTVGKQSAVGNTTSVPFDDVFRVVHAVDIAYRTAMSKWMMNDSSILTLRLAKDGQGRYLWPEMGNVQNGQPVQLAGYGVVPNNDMPAMAASAVWSTFGDHRYYKIRRIKGITIVRINELYVESGQVGFLAFQSADGGYANPGQDPIKGLQNSAT